MIDTGFITKEDAIKIVQDRTNHEKDDLIENFWNTYTDYAVVDDRILNLISKLKDNNYNIYLLSNINLYTHEKINESKLLDLVDGYAFSYKEHMVKPYIGIYNKLISRYLLIPEETLFVDDNQKNIDTGNKIGFISRKVEPDNYESVISLIIDKSIEDIKYIQENLKQKIG